MNKSVVGVLLALSGVLFAQNNQVVDTFLAKAEADFDTAAYLLLVGSGQIPENSSLAVARAKALEAGWSLTEADAAQPLYAGTWAHMLHKGLGLGGGVMYSLFGGGWYAFKEARFKGWYPEGFSAYKVLQPWEAVQAMNAAMELAAAVKEAANE